MDLIHKNIKWIMIVSGVITCTMILAAVSPQTALSLTFGETVEGPIAQIVVRNWGALITLTDVLLIYGAYQTLQEINIGHIYRLRPSLFYLCSVLEASLFIKRVWP